MPLVKRSKHFYRHVFGYVYNVSVVNIYRKRHANVFTCGKCCSIPMITSQVPHYSAVKGKIRRKVRKSITTFNSGFIGDEAMVIWQ